MLYREKADLNSLLEEERERKERGKHERVREKGARERERCLVYVMLMSY